MPWSFTEQVAAGLMLEELQQSKLVVCKIRTDNGYIRAPICSNPDWYSKLCDGYLRPRKRYPKMRTIIKRCNTIRLLERIANGIQNEDTAYAQRIRPLIEEWLNVTRFDMPTKSIAAKNGIANEIAALIDAGSLYPTARIEFRTSIGPQTPDSAATGTLLATLYFSYPAFKAAFNGVALANDIATDFSIESTGTPQYYRIYNRDGIAVFDGPVSTINGYAYGGVLGEIQFDNVNFLAGGVCSLTTLSITVP